MIEATGIIANSSELFLNYGSPAKKKLRGQRFSSRLTKCLGIAEPYCHLDIRQQAISKGERWSTRMCHPKKVVMEVGLPAAKCWRATRSRLGAQSLPHAFLLMPTTQTTSPSACPCWPEESWAGNRRPSHSCSACISKSLARIRPSGAGSMMVRSLSPRRNTRLFGA